MKSYLTLLMLPCLVMGYAMPPKPAEHVAMNPAVVSGDYGSTMNAKSEKMNHEMPKIKMPAPQINYGSIKKPTSVVKPEAHDSHEENNAVQPAEVAKQQTVVAEGADKKTHMKVTNPCIAKHDAVKQQAVEETAEQKVPTSPHSYASMKKAVEEEPVIVSTPLCETKAAKEVSATEKPMQVITSYSSMKQEAVDQKVDNTFMIPPPPNYGSVKVQAIQVKAKETPAPVVAPDVPEASPGSPASYGSANMPTSYGAMPKKTEASSESHSETAVSSATSHDKQVGKMPTSYGSYNSMSHNESSSKDQMVPKKIVVSAPMDEDEVEEEIDENEVAVPPPTPDSKKCVNKNELCNYWKETGECENNALYMTMNCAVSCGMCPK